LEAKDGLTPSHPDHCHQRADAQRSNNLEVNQMIFKKLAVHFSYPTPAHLEALFETL
jgi:hypothetical protein